MSRQKKIDEIKDLVKMKKRFYFRKLEGLTCLTLEETKLALLPEDYDSILSEIAPEDIDKEILRWEQLRINRSKEFFP